MSGWKSESRYYVSTTHHQKPVGFFKKPTEAKKAVPHFENAGAGFLVPKIAKKLPEMLDECGGKK
jgi:hypothetical protein